MKSAARNVAQEELLGGAVVGISSGFIGEMFVEDVLSGRTLKVFTQDGALYNLSTGMSQR